MVSCYGAHFYHILGEGELYFTKGIRVRMSCIVHMRKTLEAHTNIEK